MEVWIIVATARDRAIGRDGAMPWHLSDDLRRLKATTTGHAVIMGRHTWDSIGVRPLPNRYNIVVSRTLTEGDAKTHYVTSTLEQALPAGGLRARLHHGGRDALQEWPTLRDAPEPDNGRHGRARCRHTFPRDQPSGVVQARGDALSS